MVVMEATNDNRATGPSLYLYAAMIQRRIPRIRSTIKRALSQDYNTLHRNHISRHDSVSSCSPPPSYRTEESDTPDENFDFQSLENNMAASRPSSSGSSTPAYQEEEASGVRWRFALPGFQILRLAEAEAAASVGNSNLVRSQYINGAACILQGLPDDLTPSEAVTLREAIANFLAAEGPRTSQQLIVQPRQTARNDRAVALQQQSVLHRGVAFATLHIFLVVSFLVPYVHMLLQQAYQFDRRYKISDRVFAHSVMAADKMGRGTMTIASQVCAMNDGKVGELVKEIGIYVVQGFGGGIYDGVGESLSAFGIRAEGRPNSDPHSATTRQRPQSSSF